MTVQTGFTLHGRNPDILACIANLSNDEVFTPPELANQMLDQLADAWAADNDGANIWADPTLTFLDPFTKSGVFLREITSRLVDGLATQIPDLEERVDHILTKQVFGIAITQLTALMARRTLYCSKSADGKYSIGHSFDSPHGNIWFQTTEHEWVGATNFAETADAEGKPIRVGTNGKCRYCGASQKSLDRGAELETHAYAFIHTDNIRARIAELFGEDMQFDVIIGNPPYQLQSDGGTRDIPIYQRFVEQAKKLEPRYLSMVIPSRWMASGLGLGSFREAMLSDRHISHLVDFPVSSEVFPGVEVKAGVCYFLWRSEYEGNCSVSTVRGPDVVGPTERVLDEFDVFVRDSRAVPILNRVLAFNEVSVNSILAADKEFGWTSNFDGFHDRQRRGDVPLYYIRKSVRSVGYINRKDVPKSAHLIDKWKVLVPKAGSDGGQKIPDVVLGKPKLAASPSVCTQSFLFFYVDSEAEALSVQSYYCTKFFRFLVSLRKITQDATNATYTWVPIQQWDREWTDEDLYAKYGFEADEIAFIEASIKSMELPDD